MRAKRIVGGFVVGLGTVAGVAAAASQVVPMFYSTRVEYRAREIISGKNRSYRVEAVSSGRMLATNVKILFRPTRGVQPLTPDQIKVSPIVPYTVEIQNGVTVVTIGHGMRRGDKVTVTATGIKIS